MFRHIDCAPLEIAVGLTCLTAMTIALSTQLTAVCYVPLAVGAVLGLTIKYFSHPILLATR
jgi:hypothetical protein